MLLLEQSILNVKNEFADSLTEIGNIAAKSPVTLEKIKTILTNGLLDAINGLPQDLTDDLENKIIVDFSPEKEEKELVASFKLALALFNKPAIEAGHRATLLVDIIALKDAISALEAKETKEWTDIAPQQKALSEKAMKSNDFGVDSFGKPMAKLSKAANALKTEVENKKANLESDIAALTKKCEEAIANIGVKPVRKNGNGNRTNETITSLDPTKTTTIQYNLKKNVAFALHGSLLSEWLKEVDKNNHDIIVDQWYAIKRGNAGDEQFGALCKIDSAWSKIAQAISARVLKQDATSVGISNLHEISETNMRLIAKNAGYNVKIG